MSLPIDLLAAALARHRLGDHAGAEAGYRTALEYDPHQPNALYLLGVLLTETAREAEAVAVLRRAAALHPGDADTQMALARACAATGARVEAAALYRAVLAERPADPAALHNLALMLAHQGDGPAAVAACSAALAQVPQSAQARVGMAGALLAAGRVSDAIAAYRDAVAALPSHAPAHAGLALALLRAGRAEAAAGCAEHANRLDDALATGWFARGVALRATGRASEAASALERAVGLDPEHASAWLALGNAEADRDRLDAALPLIEHAIRLDPALPEAHASLGHVLTSVGRLAEAEAACGAAIDIDPGFAPAWWNRAVARLLAGNFADGFRDAEWRKRHQRFAADFAGLTGPEWTGLPLDGRHLLVHAGQGLGDTIQFARYLPLLVARGAEVVVACAGPVAPLLRGIPGVTVVPRANPPACDLWVDQMSLPLRFGTTEATVPMPDGYLRADTGRRAAWRRGSGVAIRIGLVWAGNPDHPNDRRRSLPPGQVTTLLRPLLASARHIPRLRFIGLQHGPRHGELDPALGVPDLSADLSDLSEAAALIETLDLVITVDTAVAHLAGALGKSVWVMLPHAPDWRWQTGRSDSPWYASMRLFRQDRPGNWAGVVSRVAAALRSRFVARPRAGTASMASVAITPVTTMPRTISAGPAGDVPRHRSGEVG